jgi:hypothetical protein
MIDTIFELQQQVIDGNANALEAYINLKKLEKALATVIANVQPYAMDEASRYGERTFDKFGAKVELKNAAARWDYANCIQVNHLSAKLKTMQELAQLAVNSELYDEDGLRIEAAKKVEGKSTISVTINK